MLPQIKEYLINLWLECRLAASSKQLIVFALVLASVAAFFYVRTSQEPSVVVEKPLKGSTQVIFIDISGEIKKPGVYEVPAGSRLLDVVRKAGGFTKNANRNSVNLASRLTDEQKIVISSTEVSSAESSLVNINSASTGELEDLPGIGEVIAQRIVSKRESDGPFKKIEDLNNVEGIGPKKFDQLKSLISVF